VCYARVAFNHPAQAFQCFPVDSLANQQSLGFVSQKESHGAEHQSDND